MRFACVWVGDKYPIGFVNRLRSGIERHYPHPHTFVCLTDKPSQVEGAVDITHLGLTGWWVKLALLDPSIRGAGRTVFLDLDTVIVGDLAPLACIAEPFAMCENFHWRLGIKGCGQHSSAVMVFGDGWGEPQWRAFNAWRRGFLGHKHGDQGVFGKLVPNAAFLQSLLPNGYFLHYRDLTQTQPKEAALVIYAGKRNPINYGPPWALKAWLA